MSGGNCPYCRTAFEADDAIVACSGCQTIHHADCLEENAAAPSSAALRLQRKSRRLAYPIGTWYECSHTACAICPFFP